ncbi:copper resistance CopC family protein [Propionibacteriaceae bacterium Y2011]
MRVLVRLGCVFVLVGAMLFGSTACSTPARAHVEAVASSSPEHRSVVTELDAITITFTGTTRPDFATYALRSADQRDHGLAAPVHEDDDTVVVLTPEQELPDGLYRVAYQIMFDDGHAASGVIQFELSADGVARAGEWPASDPAPARPEPERADVGGLLPWLIGIAAVGLAAFTVVLVRARRRTSGPGSGQT